MPDAITLPVSMGCATGIDPTLLEPGYLQVAEGVVYNSGDPAARKIGGRVAFNSNAPASAAINGINFNSFDTRTDYVTAQINGSLYSGPTTTGVFTSIRTGLTSTANTIGRTKFADAVYMCNGVDTDWVHKNDNTTFRWGLTAQTVAPTAALGGAGLTGTFIYWTTEYDATNDVESANDNATITSSPANQTVTITKPATVNSSATHWRLYRTIASGTSPIGWRVATVVIATTTYADSTSDANLVLLAPYDIVSVNDIPEPQNFPPPILRSVTTFEGSLVGVADRSLYFSETGTPHYFPESYVIPFRPTWGGQARCVRTVNKVCLVFFDHDTFRVNSLPKAADSFFDTGVIQERIAHYGTPSPLGACTFSGWGGSEMVFVASRSGPMITDGNAFDYAVGNIDWENTVPLSLLSTAVAIDNPDDYRIEFYYNDDTADATSWRRLDFYYGNVQVTQKRGFPELIWTGPHAVPGPGTFGILNGAGTVWTGDRRANGAVYQEDVGYTDVAQLVDSSGTINFNLRTGALYADGINSQARAGRIFLSKHGTSTGNYSVTCNWHREGAQDGTTLHNISALIGGATSNDFDRGFQSVDVSIARNDTLFMPPINNLTIAIKDVGEFVKTNRR